MADITDLPESWPPSEEEPGGRVVPVFPLPNVWLHPLVVLPLHIFEERYKQMIEDSLDGPGRLVLATIEEGHESETAGDPPFHPVAGLGEIGRHERVEDGRFNIFLVGLGRVHVEEVESDRLYRKVRVRPAEEIEVPREREAELRQALVDAIKERAAGEVEEAHLALPLTRLVDLLVLKMSPSHDMANRLFSELDVEKRVRIALGAHGAE